MIKLMIDGKPIEVEKGTTLLKAAKSLGIEIPTLCYWEHVEPFAACRVCLVEVVKDGQSQIVTSCTYPVEEGIEVLTDSEAVRRNRAMVLELLLARCPDVSQIVEICKKYGVTETKFDKKYDDCILCGLCVRVCDELVGAHAIGFAERGPDRVVMPPFGKEPETCIGCGACAYVCPTDCIKIEDHLGRKVLHDEMTLSPKTAIRVPTLQATPNVPFIDTNLCIHEITNGCGICEKVCEPKAIRYDQKEEEIELNVGSIVIATGFEIFDAKKHISFGYGIYPNVVTTLDVEKMFNASGPTGGKLLMENGQPPKTVGIIHCVGSRDKNYNAYCSRLCCMVALKTAHLIRDKVGADVYNFYIDIRSGGKGYEEFYNKVQEDGVHFIRGRVAEVTDVALVPEEEGKLVCRVEDTLIGVVRRIPVDMVVLVVGIEAKKDAGDVARYFSCSRSADGFFLERHPKLAPVPTFTDGIFIAGACQSPKDIPDCVAQGNAAAGEVLALIDRGYFEMEPVTAEVNEEKCSGCKVCSSLCPFNAIEFDNEKKVSYIIDTLCKGCGTCVAACPSNAIKQNHFTNEQILAEIEGVLGYV